MGFGTADLFGTGSSKNNNIGKYILIGILIILALPVIGGFGAAVVGLLGGIFGVLLACTVGVACAGVGFTVGGVVLFVMSIVRMVTYTAEGLLMMGGSLILIALGILAFMLTAVIFKRFIPWVIRGIAGLFRRIFRRGGRFHEKSTKIWLIAALILALAGGGLCVAALSIGVNFPEVRQNIMDGTYNLFGRNIFGWDDDVADVDEPEDILYGALSADGSVTVPVADKKEMEALYVDMDFGKPDR